MFYYFYFFLLIKTVPDVGIDVNKDECVVK